MHHGGMIRFPSFAALVMPAALAMLGSCSSSSSTSTDSGGSGSGIPAMITLTGTTSSVGIAGKAAAAGVAVEIHLASDDSMIGSGTSDGSGNYSISVATHGAAVDGYLTAAMGTTYVPTYLYPPKPLSADFSGATVLLLTSSTLSTAAALGGTSQTSGDGFIGADVFDASAAPVAGATVTATVDGAADGTVVYDGSGSSALPSNSATSTAADGTSYVFSVTPGTATVAASKSGITFSSHTVKTYADSVTLTIIEP
jgi:hypothetical protein